MQQLPPPASDAEPARGFGRAGDARPGGRTPNYRMRRLTAGAVAAVAVVAAGAGLWSIGTQNGPAKAKPDTSARLARLVDGKLELLDAKAPVGNTAATITVNKTIDVGRDFEPLSAGNPPGHLVAASLAADGTLTSIDIATGKVTRIRPGGGLSSGSAEVKGFGPTTVAVVDESAGVAVVVDVVSGKKVDVRSALSRPKAQLYEIASRFSPGRHVYGFYDGTDTGAVVLSTSDPSDAWQVAGLVLDVSGTTSLAVPKADLTGSASVRLAVFERDKLTDRTATLAAVPLGAVLRADGTALVVTKDGTMQIVSFGAGAVAPVAAGTLGFVPNKVFRIDADRLFASGEGGSAVVDLFGKVVRSWAPAAAGVVVPFRSGTACGVFQPGYGPLVRPGSDVQLIDLTTGGILATFATSAVNVSDDGCTAATRFAGAEITVAGKRVELPDAASSTLLALDADGTRAVVRRGTGEQATQVVVDLATMTETPLGPGTYLFVDQASRTSGTTSTSTTKPGSTTTRPTIGTIAAPSGDFTTTSVATSLDVPSPSTGDASTIVVTSDSGLTTTSATP